MEQRVYQKSAGCGWFEAESDWCASWSGIDQLRRRLHACNRATGGHS